MKAHGYVEPAEEAAKQHDLCPALGSLMITFGDQGKDIAGILPNVCSLYDIIVDEECKFETL